MQFIQFEVQDSDFKYEMVSQTQIKLFLFKT